MNQDELFPERTPEGVRKRLSGMFRFWSNQPASAGQVVYQNLFNDAVSAIERQALTIKDLEERLGAYSEPREYQER